MDALKIALDKVSLVADTEPSREGCDFSQESIDNAPPVELEDEDELD